MMEYWFEELMRGREMYLPNIGASQDVCFFVDNSVAKYYSVTIMVFDKKHSCSLIKIPVENE